MPGQLFRSSGGDNPATPITSLGSEVDYPVGGLNDIEIVFDDNHCVAMIPQPVQHRQKLLDIVEVKSSGRFIENIQSMSSVAFR